MEIILQIALLIIGFVVLIKGADWLVSGASSIATNFKISKVLIGLTVVAFGTSAPELAVSISSLASGSTDMLLGNVIGSNIINILLLVGVAALICPIKVSKDTVKKEIPILLLISTALVVLFLDTSLANGTINEITRGDAIICLLFFCIFLYYLIVMAKRNREAKSQKTEEPKYKLGKSSLITIVGLAGLVLGSQLVVNSASFIASAMGVSERIIALTVIAIGTSLPELVTTIVAARRKETDLIVGNIIGSNIFNVLLILGGSALINPLSFADISYIDLGILLASALALLTSCHIGKKNSLDRLDGVLFLILWAGYMAWLIVNL